MVSNTTVDKHRNRAAAFDAVIALITASCTPLAAPAPVVTTVPEPTDPSTSTVPHTNPPTAPVDSQTGAPHDEVRHVSLSGDSRVKVPRSDLTARISSSWHKTRAPLSSVSVLFERGSGMKRNKAQMSWRIESGDIPRAWRPLEGRRYDEASRAYVDERIPGWLVRLDSIDDQSAGGDPIAITISIKPNVRSPRRSDTNGRLVYQIVCSG